MKGIYLILAIVLISIFINRIFSLRVVSAEEARSEELRSSAMNDLNMLSGNEKCLAFKEKDKIENAPLELSLHSIIDVKKLDDFVANFPDVEPSCARDYKFNYRIRVETLPIDITSTEVTKKHRGVFGEILEMIDGKKTLFVLDSSGSMSSAAGPVSKIECLKHFMKRFVEELSPGSGIAMIVYGLSTGDKCRSELGKPGCCIKKFSDLAILDGNRGTLLPLIDSLSPTANTPIALALEEGFSYSKNNGINTIVLLTDGEETCDAPKRAVEVARAHKDDGIVVHTIGFGSTGIDFDLLKDVAKLTGGKFFDARLCEELVETKPKEQINVNIPPMVWEFGSSTFSKDDSLKRKITTSIPINVYFNENRILPARMIITIADGEMETFINSIEQSCSTLRASKTPMFFSYPTYIESKNGNYYVCMDFISGKECQRIACDIPVEFQGIKNPGNYVINIKPFEQLIRITV